MQNSKFLGVCLLISSLILSVAIVYHGKASSDVGRYQFHASNPPGVIWVIDTTTGKVKSQNG
ncbi:MAG: hypothetical protein GX621_01170 [Pirellulaceae bacterium]|nr:hypothetical protein [Pirellulaceae bacterium]